MLLLQFIGYPPILAYTTQIFQASNVGLDMYTSTILTSIGMLVGAIVYTLIVDYVGRIALFIWPMIGCCLSLICLGAFFLCKDVNMDLSNFSFVPATAITSYSFLTAIGMASILLLRNEGFATEVRSVSIAATYAVLHMGAFVSCQVYPVMIESLGYVATYWFYASVTVVAILQVLATLSETRGKSIDVNITSSK